MLEDVGPGAAEVLDEGGGGVAAEVLLHHLMGGLRAKGPTAESPQSQAMHTEFFRVGRTAVVRPSKVSKYDGQER